jgi:hypothetical protein
VGPIGYLKQHKGFIMKALSSLLVYGTITYALLFTTGVWDKISDKKTVSEMEVSCVAG